MHKESRQEMRRALARHDVLNSGVVVGRVWV